MCVSVGRIEKRNGTEPRGVAAFSQYIFPSIPPSTHCPPRIISLFLYLSLSIFLAFFYICLYLCTVRTILLRFNIFQFSGSPRALAGCLLWGGKNFTWWIEDFSLSLSIYLFVQFDSITLDKSNRNPPRNCNAAFDTYTVHIMNCKLIIYK